MVCAAPAGDDLRSAGLAGASLCAAFVAAGVMIYAQDAAGCGGGYNALEATHPTNVGSAPANASVLFRGTALLPDSELSVTVDGSPAALTLASFPADRRLFGLNITPPPAPGAQVQIVGDVCAGLCAVDLSFTTTTPDSTPPEALTSVRFDLHVATGFDSDCGLIGTGATFFLTVEPALEASPDAALLHKIEVFSDETLSTLLAVRGHVVDGGAGAYPITIGSVPSPDVCVRVSAVDASGNAAPGSSVSCKPCYLQTAQQTPFTPDWGPSDIYPGGPCDSGSPSGAGGQGTGGGSGGSDPGSDTDGASGCSCAQSPRNSAPAMNAGLLLFGWLLASRRSRPLRRRIH